MFVMVCARLPEALPQLDAGQVTRSSMYSILKSLHTILAALTISGFLLRGYWMLTGSGLFRNRVTRIAPHIVDTLFLATAIWMVVEVQLAPLAQAWLQAKLVGLLAYIGLGMIAFRFSKTVEARIIAFVGAITSFTYVVGAAVSKSPWSWLAYLTS